MFLTNETMVNNNGIFNRPNMPSWVPELHKTSTYVDCSAFNMWVGTKIKGL